MPSVNLKIRHNAHDVARALNSVADKALTRAHFDAQNRALAKGRTVIVRAVAKLFRVQSRLVRKRVLLRRANKANRRALLSIATAYGLSAVRLRPTQARQGIRHNVPGGRRVTAGSFFGRSRLNKTRLVFIRRGKSRLPLNVIRVAIHEHAEREANDWVSPAGTNEYEAQFIRRFEFFAGRELNRVVRRG